ncbi:GDSL-type esterase/lipase family protein [Dyadobacter sp. 32]|uniref:SGNH/GDSL hydrolase family protein n=1 Tax=Dyadobacter sp. 32 TaxID=538966 RepID=UPI0011EC0B16
MKAFSFILIIVGLLPSLAKAQIAKSADYLADIKRELTIQWPKNRTINLVFHGHSVPAGYWNNHEVHTLESYPNQVLKELKVKFPYVPINVIVTAIGGENSIKGAARFESDVLVHKPDVLFIDYALNDRFMALDQTREALEKMIKLALSKGVKVILVTPSPDQRIDISNPSNPLDPYADQILTLARQYQTGLADPYADFKKIAKDGKLASFMSSVNHPNEAGHALIAGKILAWF